MKCAPQNTLAAISDRFWLQWIVIFKKPSQIIDLFIQKKEQKNDFSLPSFDDYELLGKH